MQATECISFRASGYFSELICDYLDQKPGLRDFYHRFPSLENFAAQIEEKQTSFKSETRQILVESLLRQYARLNDRSLSAEASLANIRLLKEENTFSVTTGHQLNIFTGPLYFLYKIVSTIKLAKQLNAEYSDKQFVPVYWMATEDHDFDEINFINLYGGRLRWEQNGGGPVGRLNTASLAAVIKELEEHLGPGTRCEELIALFRDAYLEHKNLADATRFLVHQLFGKEGLVIIDADDRHLKSLALPYFKKDLFEHSAQAMVEPVTSKLEELHFKQVHPREINLFYIVDGLRERIERKQDRWLVLNTDLSFSKEELESELQDHPDRFSPNVVLRPLYQELILPNLAYIGGGGELAYWFQLKKMFEALAVPFPMLVLRNSVLWIDKKRQRKMEDLGLSVPAVFQPLHQLKKSYVKEHAPMDTELDPYERKLEKIFDELEELAQLTDKSMLGAVNAQRQKQLNGLEKLRKKLIRAEKRRHSTDMEKIERVFLALFPNESLQERHDNFSTYFCEYGPGFIQSLLTELDPLDFRFRVILASK